MFRCPHCRARTITAGAKLKIGWSTQKCPECGTALTPSWFGGLVAGTAGVLGMVPPLIFLSPFPIGRAWLVLAATAVSGMVTGIIAYLLATPLIAAGSSTARYDRFGYVVLVAGLILIAIASEYLQR